MELRSGIGPGAALVTGAGRRIGRAMALYLAERGFDVAVHYAHSAPEAEALCAEIRALGRRAVALAADLLDETQTEALMGRALAALGPVAVLVNNASIFEPDLLQSASRSSWDRHIGSNLRAPYQLIQAFAAQCPKARLDAGGEPRAAGLVVNMIDQRVWKPTPQFSTYSVAKMGLWGLTRTAAQGLAPQIRVNAIGPGPTLCGPRQQPEDFANQRRATLLGRGADLADITAALGFFLDSPAVTGQMIAVDGGQHLAWQTPDVMGEE